MQPHPAREINQRLLFAERTQHLRRCLQRRELPIVIEDVELAVVLPKGSAGVRAACVVDRLHRSLPFAHDHRLENAEQPIAIPREVLHHIDRSSLIAHDGDQIGGGHLCADKLPRRRKSTQLIVGRHRRHVEIERQQPMIAVLRLARALRRNLCPCECLIEHDLLVVERGYRHRSCSRRQSLMLKDLDGLRLTILGDGKVFGCQARNKIALHIFHDNRLDHQLRVDGECERPVLPRHLVRTRLLRRRREARCDHRRENRHLRKHPKPAHR